jgi:hypothetical protein
MEPNKLLIPKICHLYWDNSPMSWLQTLTINSFHRYNPDWKIIVYSPIKKSITKQNFVPEYRGKDYFYLVKEKDYVEFKIIDLREYGIMEELHDILRSDIFRYKILHQFGGVWSDFDVIWIKPIQHLTNLDYLNLFDVDVSDFICMYNQFSGHHNISVMMHKKNSEFVKSLILKTDEIQKTLGTIVLDHQTFGTVMLNQMYPTFLNIKEKFHKVIPLKYETIFPYSIYNMESLYNITNLTFINNNVLCIHWFNGHILSKEYVNKNKYEYDCSMSNILKNEKWI